jgi:hypothetical protein
LSTDCGLLLLEPDHSLCSDERIPYDDMYADESYKHFRKKGNPGQHWGCLEYHDVPEVMSDDIVLGNRLHPRL